MELQIAFGIGINLASTLLENMLKAGNHRLNRKLNGDEQTQAMQRCLSTAIASTVTRANLKEQEQENLLDDIFTDFFKNAGVASEVAALATGLSMDRKYLGDQFYKLDYDAATLQGLPFTEAMAAFESAFLAAVETEPLLKNDLELNQIKATLTEMQKDWGQKIVYAINANDIHAVNVATEQHIAEQNIYIQWDSQQKTDTSAPDWKPNYLEKLRAHCEKLDMTPIDEKADALLISKVFTTLYLENVYRLGDKPLIETLRPKAKQSEQEKEALAKSVEAEKESRLPVTAIEAIAELPRLVILGEPGGGKSTLTNHIITQLARRQLGTGEASLLHWPDEYNPLPVRIILRHFSNWLDKEGRNKGAVGDIWAYLEQLLDDWGCADSFYNVKRTLQKEGGIVFFDGLDELRNADKRKTIIRGAVAKFAESEEKCRVVVTSRPYAYKKGSGWRLPDNEFVTVSLALFEKEQIESFNEAWYTRWMQYTRSWSVEMCRQRAAYLSHIILKRPHLYKLARYPLLLTLIAQVDSNGSSSTLPNDRASLYERMVTLLLARWENRLDQDAYLGVEGDRVLSLGVPTEDLHTILAKLAYEGHEAQGAVQAEQESTEADSQVAEIAHSELHMALIEQFETKTRVDQIIDYISQRAGLLVERESGISFAFPHRTYQEYLAAQYLIKQSDGQKELCQKLEKQPDWWKEVFLLSAGSGIKTPVYVQNLLNELLPNKPDEEKASSVVTSVMIAAQALYETNFRLYVKQEKREGGFTAIYRRIQEWLQILMAADKQLSTDIRIESAGWLSKLGDNRLGVGVNLETGLPDIAWGSVVKIDTTRTYTIGQDGKHDDEKVRNVPIKGAYQLAMYPITNIQFNCFIEAKDRDDPKWWKKIPEKEKSFSDSRWPYDNHPRTNVSWYQAMAFCRWLTNKLHEGKILAPPVCDDVKEYEITLPHEYEWETAARWNGKDTDGRFYPYKGDFNKNKANTSEGGVRQTTAVGLYPSGKNEALDLYDMSGNVWEWCRNKYQSDKAWRALRGGSWINNQINARAASRNFDFPHDRNGLIGFRVAVVRRSPSH